MLKKQNRFETQSIIKLPKKTERQELTVIGDLLICSSSVLISNALTNKCGPLFLIDKD